jgi:hypothetical protein
MHSSTLFYVLSALVASSSCTLAAPSHPSDGSVAEAPAPGVPQAVSYAGAPADGAYPAEVENMGGWESDAPTYDTAVSLILLQGGRRLIE